VGDARGDVDSVEDPEFIHSPLYRHAALSLQQRNGFARFMFVIRQLGQRVEGGGACAECGGPAVARDEHPEGYSLWAARSRRNIPR
jgi:hypothetical protein